MEPVLKFIYYGEVTVEQVNLKTFFEELEVKGLVRGNTDWDCDRGAYTWSSNPNPMQP